MIPSAGTRFGHELARFGSCGIRGARSRDELRHELADQLDVRIGEAVEERRRRLVRLDVDD